MNRLLYIISLIVMAMPTIAQTTSQNYILTRTFTKVDASNYLDQIQYFDGLGRPIETVTKGITPDGSDLVSLSEYDALGRMNKQWLPMVFTQNSGAYVDPTRITTGGTKDYYDNDTKPYRETKYENFALNRILQKYGEGVAWASKPINIKYQNNSSDNEVSYFYVNSSGNLVKQGFYPINSLFKNIVTDEDNKTATEYKDPLGQVVMKQNSTDVKTYYVYDDFGHLRYVLPPLATDALTVDGTYTDATPALKQYAYLYKYDERGNNVMKRLPGCDSICMVYDKADHMVLSQDGNQRQKKQWMVTKYDALGRVAYIGTIIRNQSRLSLKSILDPLVITESYNGSTTFYNTGYTCNYFTGEVTPLAVNYYDNYKFRKMQTQIADTTKLIYTTLTGYDAQYQNAKGLLTGTRTYILDKSGNYLVTAFYYNDRGQVVQSCASNQQGGYDLAYNHYDFTGKVLNTYKKHNILGQAIVEEAYTYIYDNAGRPTVTTYKFNNDVPIILSSKTYDNLGRLQYNYRHNAADTIKYRYNIRNWITQIKNGSFSEYLKYNSSTDVPFTPCFNGNIASAEYNYNGTYRTYVYGYDLLNRLISSVSFQFSGGYPSSSINSESMAYDKQGNITGLSRQNGTTVVDNLTTINYNGNQLTKVTDQKGSQSLSALKEYNDAVNLPIEFYYDKNGNMKTDLDRNIVTIRYNILNLPDTIQFKNGNQILNRYAADGRKLSTDYLTRKLALATPIDTGTVHKWVYDRNLMSITGTTYIGNVEYYTIQTSPSTKSYKLERVHNTEGYADNINSSYISTNYCYLRRDHLGNTREVWRAPYTVFVNNNTLNPAAVVQRTQYYPSGLPWAEGNGASVQPYKYNGKEFVEMHGYDTYDYGARGYYAALGRFSCIDRFAEKYVSLTPYHYAANNPIKYIDVNGDSLWITHNTGFLGLGGKKTVLYENGNIYNKDGSAYTGKVRGFLSKSVNALNIISGTQEGGNLVGELQSSTNNFTLIRGDSKFTPSSSTKAYANQIQTDPANAETLQALQNAGVNLAGGSGGTISWNPSGTTLTTINGPRVNGTTDLAHEMFHGLDANRGLSDDRLDQGIERNEWQAVYRENMLRSQLGQPLRTHYIKTVDENGAFISGSGTRMLTPANQIILPTWYKP